MLFFQSRNAARTFAQSVNSKGAAKASVKDNKDSPSLRGSRYGVVIVKGAK